MTGPVSPRRDILRDWTRTGNHWIEIILTLSLFHWAGVLSKKYGFRVCFSLPRARNEDAVIVLTRREGSPYWGNTFEKIS